MKNTFVWLLLYNIIVVACWGGLSIFFNKWWLALFAILFIAYPKIKYGSYRICDGCGKHGPYADSPNEAIEKAVNEGWVHSPGDNKDYCPDCQHEVYYQ